MKAILRKVRISPKKANLVAGMVRGKKVTDALEILEFMPKKGAAILYKVVHSAAANAQHNFKQSLDDLFITRLVVTKGPGSKRWLPISRGRVHPIDKQTSHITVEVGVLAAEKTPAKAVDSEPAPSAETTDSPQAAVKKAGSKKARPGRAKKPAPKKTASKPLKS